MNTVIKRIGKFYFGLAAGAACCAGLAVFFMAQPARLAARVSDIDTNEHIADTHDSAAPAADGGGQRPDDSHTHDSANARTAPELRITTGVSNEITGGANNTNDAATTPGMTAALKEKLIRDRFGAILRDGKWIPTAGGGTNLVYITTGSLPPTRIGECYEAQFTAESGCPPYQWGIAAGALPPAFTLDQRSGKLTGTPDTTGTAVFMLEVADSHGAKDMAEYVLTVQPEQPLAILTQELPSALPGTNFFCRFQAAGGIPPYTWSAIGDIEGLGTLALDQYTGELYGEIAADAPQIGVPITVWLHDAQFDVSREFILHIRNGLNILDIPESPIRQNAYFEHIFKTDGGTAPYAWNFSGTLPPGMEFSPTGILSGQPSESGSYEINIAVMDAAGQLDSVQFALKVLPMIPETVSNFQALLSRNSVALQWDAPEPDMGITVRIVKSSTMSGTMPENGTIIYSGYDTSCIDGDAGAGCHCYTAFIEENGVVATASAPATVRAVLPPTSDPFADQALETRLLHPNAFRSAELPGIVMGAPRGAGLAWGSSDVVSLGAAINDDDGATAPYGGAITLKFEDNVAWDGPGADFTIFENVFYVCDGASAPNPETRFMEPAVVAVSQDGVTWRQFKTDFSPRYHPDTGRLNLRHPYCYNAGFAGVNPVMSNGLDPDPTDPAVSGGDSFDIADLEFDWIRYVRIQSTGSRWLMDNDGDLVYHNEESNAAARDSDKAGFDLDAVAAIWFEKVTAMAP